MNNTTKAVVATVDLGFKKVEGLMLPSGDYAITVPQIAATFQFTPKHASQTLKRLLGNDFSPHKIKTELGKQLINVVMPEDFAEIIRALDRKL